MKTTPPASASPLPLPALSDAARKLRLRQTLRVRDMGKLLLRPIQPKDEALMVDFHRVLSEETIYMRYFEHMVLESRIRHERLTRICTNNGDTFALVAVSPAPPGEKAVISAVGRLSRTDDPVAVDFAILVADKAQGRGIGSALMRRLINLARACGFTRLVGEVLMVNHEMLYVCRQFGFTLHSLSQDGLVLVSLELKE